MPPPPPDPPATGRLRRIIAVVVTILISFPFVSMPNPSPPPRTDRIHRAEALAVSEAASSSVVVSTHLFGFGCDDLTGWSGGTIGAGLGLATAGP